MNKSWARQSGKLPTTTGSRNRIVSNLLTSTQFFVYNFFIMKKLFTVILLFAALCIHSQQIDQALMMKGHQYYSAGYFSYIAGDYGKAIENYKQAYNLILKSGNKVYAAIILEKMGFLYREMESYGESFSCFAEEYKLLKGIGDKNYQARVKMNLVTSCILDKDPQMAVKKYNEMFTDKLDTDGILAKGYSYLADEYAGSGKFDYSIDYYNKALESFTKKQDEKNILMTELGLGKQYLAWGDYGSAENHLNKVLENLGKTNDLGTRGSLFKSLADLYVKKSEYQKAEDYYRNSLEIFKKNKDKKMTAGLLLDTGDLYYKTGKYKKAEESYKQCYTTGSSIKDYWVVAKSYEGLAMVNMINNETGKALENLQDALNIHQIILYSYSDYSNIDKMEKAKLCDRIGRIYYETGDYDRALEYFKQSAGIKNELRLNAAGKIRRDYLEEQIITFQYLVFTYFKKNDFADAFNTREESSSIYLFEQMEKKSADNASFVDARDYINNVNENEIYIDYLYCRDLNSLLVLALDNSNIYAEEISLDNLHDPLKNNGIGLIQKNGSRNDLEKAIYTYRDMLANPGKATRGLKEAKNNEHAFTDFEKLGSILYNLLLKKMENRFAGKKTIIIIPNDILGLLPFGALVDNNNRYLVENHNVRYVQSLTIETLVKNRNYSDKRKSMLAFGDAVYDEASKKDDAACADYMYAEIRNAAFLNSTRGKSQKNEYTLLGFSKWENLPGTLAEVRAIKNEIKDADVFTGKKTSEDFIKELSRSGKLKDYRIIHFAAHGIFIPQTPELSAIVLSQDVGDKSGEDGYLTAGEIAGLDINADFVNLSACETGLGKIYSSEGVVGLTQSFLIAGANGVSTSLWQVADESTAEFMAGVYRLTGEKKLSYFEAINEMKRIFIKGAKFADPFYWAAFVYYGK